MEKCGDWEMPLSDNLGIPGCFPLHPDCPEEQLDAQTIVHGYRDSADAFGITEANETSLSLLNPASLGLGLPTQLPQPSSVLQAIKAEINTRVATVCQQTTSRCTTETTSTNAQLRLPPLRTATAEELTAWLQELAGSHDLSFMALSVPDVASKQLLLKALWYARVPAIRAAWYIRVLHLHWFTEPATTDRQPSGSISLMPNDSEDGRLARAGSINTTQGPSTKGITQKFSPSTPNTVPEPEHLLGITPDIISKCSNAWSALILEHIDNCLSAATAFLLGQPVPVGNSAGTPLLAHTPMTPYPEFPASPLPAFDMLPETALGMNPNQVAGQGAGASSNDLGSMRSQTPLPTSSQNNAATYPSALAIAYEVLAASATEVLDPGPFAKLWYFITLARHTFNEGLSQANVVLEWAEKLLMTSAGPNRWSGSQAAVDADLVKAWAGITLLQACVKDLAVTPGAAKKLATMLVQLTTDWQQLQLQKAADANQTSSIYPAMLDSKRTSNIPGWCGITFDSVRMQAADVLKVLLKSCPSVLITLDCLPQLMAESAWAQQQRLTSSHSSTSTAVSNVSVNLDELPSDPDDFASVLKVMLGNTEAHSTPPQQGRNGKRNCQVGVPVHPGPTANAAAYLSYIEDVAAYEASCIQTGAGLSNNFGSTFSTQTPLSHLKATPLKSNKPAVASSKLPSRSSEEGTSLILGCIAAKAKSMESAVHPKILVFSETAAMQRLESAFYRGDIKYGYEQLEACMGKDGFRDAESAVALACNFAVSNPFHLPDAFTRHVLNPPTQGQPHSEQQVMKHDTSSCQRSTLQPDLGPRAIFCARLLSKLHTNISQWMSNHAKRLSGHTQGDVMIEGGSKLMHGRPTSLSGTPAPATGNISSSGNTAAMSDSDMQGLAPSRVALAAAAMGKGLLQQALYKWVDSVNIQLCHNCKIRSDGSNPAHDPYNVANLLLTLQRFGLWNCKQYASKLVAEGIFENVPSTELFAPDSQQVLDNNTQVANGCNSPPSKQCQSAKTIRAARHWVLLKLLHPTAVMVCEQGVSTETNVGGHTRMHAGPAPVADMPSSLAFHDGLSYKGLRKQILSAQPQFHSAWKASGRYQSSRPLQTVLDTSPTTGHQQHPGRLQTADMQASEASQQLEQQDTAQQLLMITKATEKVLSRALTASESLTSNSASSMEDILQWIGRQPPSVQHIYAANLRLFVLTTLEDCGMSETATAVSMGQIEQLRLRIQENETACRVVASIVILQTDQEPGVSTPDLPESRALYHHNGKKLNPGRAAGVSGTQDQHGGKAMQQITETWLLDAVALLDASGAHDTAIDLLLGMLQQLSGSLLETATATGKRSLPEASASSSKALSVSHGQIIALLTALKDRLFAVGLARLLSLTSQLTVTFMREATASHTALSDVCHGPWKAFLSGLLRFAGACVSLALHGTGSAALSDLQPRQPGSNPAGTNTNIIPALLSGADGVPDSSTYDVSAWLENMLQAASSLDPSIQQWVIDQLKPGLVSNQQQQPDLFVSANESSTQHNIHSPAPSLMLTSLASDTSFDQLTKHCQRQLLRHDPSTAQTVRTETNHRLQALPNTEVNSCFQMLQSSLQSRASKHVITAAGDVSHPSTAVNSHLLTSLTQWVRKLLASKGIQLPLQQAGAASAPVRAAVASLCTAVLMTFINSQQLGEPTETSFFQNHHDILKLIQGLQQFLTVAGLSETCSCVQQGLLAAVSALIGMACSEPFPQADKRDLIATLAAFTGSAAVSGMTQLSDVVRVVVQQVPQVDSVWLHYLIGPGLLCSKSTTDSSQTQAELRRYMLSATESYMLRLLQQRLPAELIWHLIRQPLVEELIDICSIGLRQGDVNPKKHDVGVRSVILHKPLRTVLFSDPVWLHAQLRSASYISAVAAAVAKAEASGIQTLQASKRLPLLVGMVLLHVGSTPEPNQGGFPVIASINSLSDWESECRRCMHALLASVHTSNHVLVSVMVRLLLDQRAAIEMLQDDHNRQGMKEILEATQRPFNVEVDANVSSGGAGNPHPAKSVSQTGTARLTTGMPAAPLEPTVAEKLLCSCMLSQLLDTPESAALYADMAWQLGASVGTWLLRTTGWLLEDRQDVQLSGTQSIRQVVLRTRTGKQSQGHTSTATGATQLNNPPKLNTDQHITATKQPPPHRPNPCYACMQHAVTLDLNQCGWSMERAILTLALVVLSQARSQLKPFAAELVRQLGRVADILKRATTAAASYSMSSKAAKQADDAMKITPFMSGIGGAAAGGLKRGRSASMDGGAADKGVRLDGRPSKQQCLNDVTGGGGIRAGATDDNPSEVVDMDLGSPSGSVGGLKTTGLAVDEATNTRDATMRERSVSVGTSPRQSLAGRLDRGGSNADAPVPSSANDTRRSSDGGAVGNQAGSRSVNEAGTNATGNVGDGTGASTTGGGKKRAFGQGRFGRGGTLRLGNNPSQPNTGNTSNNPISTNIEAGGVGGKADNFPAAPTGTVSVSKPLLGSSSFHGSEMNTVPAMEPIPSNSNVILGPPEAIQTAVWLRLSLLLPLLPVVYSDKETDARRNLRMQLVSSLNQMLVSPVIQPGLQHIGDAATQHPLLKVLQHQSRQQLPEYSDIEAFNMTAVRKVTAEAQEFLWERLFNVLVAMLSGSTPSWPAWLKGSHSKKLKEVAPYAGTDQLLQDVAKAGRAIKAVSAVWQSAHPNPSTTRTLQADRNPDNDVSVSKVLKDTSLLALLGYQPTSDHLSEPLPVTISYEFRNQQKQGFKIADTSGEDSIEPVARRPVSMPSPIKLSLQTVLVQTAQPLPRYVNVSYDAVKCAHGPPMGRSGPWAADSKTAIDAIRNSLRTQQHGKLTQEQQALDAETAGLVGAEQPDQLVSCWVPTPIETCAPWRHEERTRPL